MNKQLFRIIAQTDSMTISADTVQELTEQDARKTARESVISPTGNYNNFIVQPLGSLNGWKYGHINFCPRCGKNISEEMGDSSDIVNNYQEFDCPECESEIFVHIKSTLEEREEESEEEETGLRIEGKKREE